MRGKKTSKLKDDYIIDHSIAAGAADVKSARGAEVGGMPELQSEAVGGMLELQCKELGGNARTAMQGACTTHASSVEITTEMLVRLHGLPTWALN